MEYSHIVFRPMGRGYPGMSIAKTAIGPIAVEVNFELLAGKKVSCSVFGEKDCYLHHGEVEVLKDGRSVIFTLPDGEEIATELSSVAGKILLDTGCFKKGADPWLDGF